MIPVTDYRSTPTAQRRGKRKISNTQVKKTAKPGVQERQPLPDGLELGKGFNVHGILLQMENT